MATAVYRLFLWLYRCGAIALSPVNKKAKLWLSGRKNVFDNLYNFVALNTKPILWCHCASLGEFEQARPLLDALRAEYPAYAVLLSFFSPSGYEVRKDYKGVDFVCYLPEDGPNNAAKFLRLVKPVLVIWVKYEYWYFYLRHLRQAGTPVLLVSAIFRQEQPFFKKWGRFHRSMLDCFTQLFVQNQPSKKLLDGIGLSANVTVSGDTRFDRVIAIAAGAGRLALVEDFIGSRPVIVAGSTWGEDEEELDHFANTHPEMRFIIAPHEVDEDRLQDIEQLFKYTIRYSALQEGMAPSGTTPNTLIIDNIGMLANLYKYALITYIGGGFGEDGVHNTLEAAVYARPVIFGPVYEKFAEAVDLVNAGAAFPVDNALQLEACLLNLLQNKGSYAAAAKAAGEYVYQNKGATGTILKFIQEKRLLTN